MVCVPLLEPAQLISEKPLLCRDLDRLWGLPDCCGWALSCLAASTPGCVRSDASCASCQKKSPKLSLAARDCFARRNEEPFLPCQVWWWGLAGEVKSYPGPPCKLWPAETWWNLRVPQRVSRHVILSEVPLLRRPLAAVKLLSVKANPKSADRRVTFQAFLSFAGFNEKTGDEGTWSHSRCFA